MLTARPVASSDCGRARPAGNRSSRIALRRAVQIFSDAVPCGAVSTLIKRLAGSMLVISSRLNCYGLVKVVIGWKAQLFNWPAGLWLACRGLRMGQGVV